jgi:hypothetical protein
MRPIVRNVRDIGGLRDMPEGDVYIGRVAGVDFARGNPNQRGYFGNPFVVYGALSREDAISQFETLAWGLAKLDPVFREAVKGLAGKTLWCWCKPEACHGETLADLCELLHGGEGVG